MGVQHVEIKKDYLSSHDYVYLKGLEYVQPDGSFLFPPELQRADTQKLSCFGPGVSIDGVRIARNNRTMADGAKYRLLAARFPDQPGRHQFYHRQQTAFITANIEFLTHVQQLFHKYFEEYKGAEEEAREHHADPHEKRIPRIHAFGELLTTGELVNPHGNWGTPSTRPVVKLNAKNETAKPNKPIRLVGDISTPASLRGAWLTNYMKGAFASEPIHWNGGIFEFIKCPDQVTMERVFRTMYSPVGRFYFVYFSDDSSLAIRVGIEIKWFNIDISSCDASHTESLFIALKWLTPLAVHDDMQQLINQCKLPVKVLSNSAFSKPKRVIIKFNTARLYSGSTLTTSINNLASLLIGLAISKLDVITEQTITEAAASAGYVITGAQPLNNFNEVQFLKHSPVLDVSGKIRALLNLGVLCRASGVCKEDLPGKGPVLPRAQAFQRGLLRGMYPRAHFTLIDRMKAAAGQGPIAHEAIQLFSRKVVYDDRAEEYTVSDDEVYRRYQLTGAEIGELNNQLGHATTGQWLASTGLSKILTLDYGLSCSVTTTHPVLPDPVPFWA